MPDYELEDEDFVGSFRASIGNGLLTIRDIESVDVHASWTGNTDIDVTPDSIYMSVQHPVDGPATAELLR